MHTPSPASSSPAHPTASATSHSDAADALLQLSQSPQPAVNGHDTDRFEQHSTDAVSPVPESRYSTPANVMSYPKIPHGSARISFSPISHATRVIKVSNSDDEDMVGPEDLRGEDIGARAPDAASPMRYPAKTPVSAFARGLAVTKRPNSTPLYRSPYAPVENSGDIDVDVSRNVGSGQFGTRASQTAYPILTIGPDELGSYISRMACSQRGSGAAFRHASDPVHLSNEPPHRPSSGSTALNGQRISATLPPDSRDPLMRLRCASQPHPQTQFMLPTANIEGRVQKESQHASSVEDPPSSPSVLPGRASSADAEGHDRIRIPHAAPRPAPKRVRVSPKTQVASAARDGFGPKQIDIRDFKYHTIKVINMPARNDLTPDGPPEPKPNSRPYDEDLDYRASFLIWLCDDLMLAYSETLRRYKIQFPDERTLTEDTVRKRHILYLEKLARKYGLKPEAEIEEPGGRVAIRGKQLGHKYNTINGVHVYSVAAGHDVAGTVRRRRAGNGPTEHRGFLKACICVWYDTAQASFEEIKLRLQNEYEWNIGVNTVKKHYYAQRARVYDTYNETGAVDRESCTRNADEDLDQLKLHYQQRQAYLLRTYGRQVPAEDIAYMQQLERLIRGKEQDQLQRMQQTGGGPVRMIEEAAEEMRDVEEGEEWRTTGTS